MAPDLNSLPPSRSGSGSPSMARAMASSGEVAALRGQSPSPLSRTSSLQATAAVNAGLHQEERRRLPFHSPKVPTDLFAGSPINTATRNRQISHPGRRRSNVIMNLQLNDPTVPGPGEMVNEAHLSSYSTVSPSSLSGSPIISSGDPHHLRNPSLGEIHQELEQEQEAQVVCLPTKLWCTVPDLYIESPLANDPYSATTAAATTSCRWQ